MLKSEENSEVAVAEIGLRITAASADWKEPTLVLKARNPVPRSNLAKFGVFMELDCLLKTKVNFWKKHPALIANDMGVMQSRL